MPMWSRQNDEASRLRHAALTAHHKVQAQVRSQELRQSRRITIRTGAGLAASASGRKPSPYPAEGGSLWIERVAVHTPGRRLPCIAGLTVRQETHHVINLGLRQRQRLHVLVEPGVSDSIALVVMIYDIPQCLHRPVVEVRPGHEDISQTRRLERGDITLLFRNEEAPEDRHLARDRRGVDGRQMSLRQLALSLLRQGGYVMPKDSDANVVNIVIHEEGYIRLIVRQCMAEVAAGLGVEQFPTAFDRVA